MPGNEPSTLAVPSAEKMLEAVLKFSRGLFVDMDEADTIQRFLDVLHEVFTDRHFVVRTVELRGDSGLKIYGDLGRVRPKLRSGSLTLKESSIHKTQLKSAVVKSARLRIDERWDSPFTGIAEGFAIPLTAAGELYGILDVGYPLGQSSCDADEDALLALTNQLAVALRNERLHRDTKALRDYQSRLIEHASALILGTDSNWRIRVCNRALCELIGIPSTDLLGKDLRESFPAVDRGKLSRIFSDVVSGTKNSTIGNAEIMSQAGRRVPVVWRAASVRRSGAVQAVVAIGQDQTMLSDLQEQLVQAEKLSTLGQMAAGVVHELNNPLTSIGVYSSFLLTQAERRLAAGEPGQSAEDVQKLARIQDAAERIKSFSQDLVQYAKPSQQDPERLSLNMVINQSLSFCSHLFSGSGVELERNLEPGLPEIVAVPGQLEQVVINLVTNAVQASGEVGVVRVSTYVDTKRVVFSIKDAGQGISKEEQTRIFEPFFTTKSDGEGTGLGLCIVRNIIKDNHGEMTVISELGQGAEFRCYLPAFQNEQASEITS